MKNVQNVGRKTGMCCNHSPEDGNAANCLTVRSSHVLATKDTFKYNCVTNTYSIGGENIYKVIKINIVRGLASAGGIDEDYSLLGCNAASAGK